MTGDLNILMQVRNKKVSKDMNVRVAEEVGEKAELGYFDTEFTMYGCAFLNPQDGKMYYKVSSLAEDIYDFIEMSAQKKIYPSNVMTYTRKVPVPSGMKELIARDVKQELAQKLRSVYPKEFFK